MGSKTNCETGSVDLEFEKNVKINLKLDSLKRHTCPFEGCFSAFNRPWKLERHINTHTKNRPFKCDFNGCTKDYTNKAHLLRHKSLSHSDNKPTPVFICCPFPDCNKIFSNKYSLKKHCNTHKSIVLYKCEKCSSTFKKHGQLKRHLFVHHLGLKPYGCKICNDIFENNKMLKRHVKKHKVYKCDEDNCFEVFTTFHALRTHIKNAHKKLFECDYCKKTYVNKWNITEHILSHLPVDSRDVLVCPYKECGRYYYYKRNLNHHLKSFHYNINYQCDSCGQSFVNKSKLRKHQKLHLKSNNPEVKPKILNITRKPRKDKGERRKSVAAVLSGIQLPRIIDKKLAQNNSGSDVSEHIENIKTVVLEVNY